MLSFDDLVARARGLVTPGRRALLGIVGSPGSGKSTLAELLLAALRADPPPDAGADWVAHVPMDGFHLADVELERLGLRQAKGAPDTFDAGGYVALLARLRAADPPTPWCTRRPSSGRWSSRSPARSPCRPRPGSW